MSEEAIIETLQLCNQVVLEDGNGTDISTVIQLYTKCVSQLDAIIDRESPPHMQSELRQKKDRFMNRLVELQTLQFHQQEQHEQLSRPPSRSSRPLSRASLEVTMEEIREATAPSNSMSLPLEEEPDNPLKRPFWMLRIVRSTILRGAWITPTFFVPKLVWAHHNARFTGYNIKSNAFSTILTLLIDLVHPLEFPSASADSRPLGEERELQKVKQALEAFMRLRSELDVLQNNLARPFPFIRELSSSSGVIPTPPIVGKMASSSAGANKNSRLPSGSSTVGSMTSRFNSMFLSIGETVRKSYERIGAAVSSKITDEELVVYASLVSEVCEKAQIVEAWYDYVNERRIVYQEVLQAAHVHADSEQARLKTSYQYLESMLVEVLHCGRFFQEVMLELLLRDLECFVESYLRKMRKTFTRIQWDLENDPSELYM